MKLKKLHMFLLLLGILLISCCGFSAIEGMTNGDSSTSSNSATRTNNNRVDANYNLGSASDPFDNAPSNNPVSNLEIASYDDILKGAVPASKMKAIPKDQIPKGDEDLYILKSQIVPPVCPKCPDVKKCDTTKDCPPCPAPQRCPDRPYECKMVPKYSDPRVSSHLPRPVLNSFDTFA
tara:strand:- start:1232 stop:1765 length:534 start_codon:yes stop_codon:yes gene_type:complete